MTKRLRIALVGDHDPTVTAHEAIPKALESAVRVAGVPIHGAWIGTRSLANDAQGILRDFDGVWCVPASPYESTDGALEAIRFARETELPFLGTCGGYQHAVLEYARHVLGFREAEHSELNPDAAMPLIAPLSCALVEKSAVIKLVDDSYTRILFGRDEVMETYHCRYGVNTRYLSIFKGSDLVFSAFDVAMEPRAVELRNHPFFIGTAFQPERSALRAESHPLISAFINASMGNL